jgi:hypothetical protein
MEVVIRARKPMDVVKLVKNITLDIWTIVSSMAFSGSVYPRERFSLNLAWIWMASPIPIIKRRVGTIYVMILISKPIRPMNPKSHITVMRTVKIGRSTWAQFRKRKLRIHTNKMAMGGRKRKLSRII